MHKNVAFTIVAKNYIGLAKLLKKSIQLNNSELDFYIFVADELNEDMKQELKKDGVIECKNYLNYTQSEWINMSFKYDITEFCTSIKPECFLSLIKLGYDKIIYFDPDIYVYSKLDIIYNQLDYYDIILTPHLINIPDNESNKFDEHDLLLSGVYNLGFLALRATSGVEKMLNWWKQKLMNLCFWDRPSNLFTDQKWIDLIPGFQLENKVLISNNLGMNLAPWNFSERKLKKDNRTWMVCNRNLDNEGSTELIFAHFSGYKYAQMMDGKVARIPNSLQLKNIEDIDNLVAEYSDYIFQNRSMFQKYIHLKYTYSTFSNGKSIDRFHRRIYDGLIKEGRNITNPFVTEGKSFYRALKKATLLNTHDSVDKVYKRTITNLDEKRKILSIFFGLIKRLIGYKRYVLFVRSLVLYSRPQEHTFLLKKQEFD